MTPSEHPSELTGTADLDAERRAALIRATPDPDPVQAIIAAAAEIGLDGPMAEAMIAAADQLRIQRRALWNLLAYTKSNYDQ